LSQNYFIVLGIFFSGSSTINTSDVIISPAILAASIKAVLEP